ncbi:MAG: aminoacyl-histidine dipeptidase [Clostridiales bacterium]|uniref:aminoacyl-histidine dipeptidase n=1 Tax=Clostridium sp. N3C TaxID=1776758 RepID=UPI00092DEFAB|nr:aminoacyl-histidine dipeptidase [Clostridium sp. N3C]NLZ47447.1 aminoacyl-histidine dipeptidase [Clostridiales bacterium]SCN21620.1 Cytosol non-specific dipeptidase [Clostridium sp. N3C]
MTEVLKGLEPEKVFYYFEEISKIPRGSGNEKAISDYLVAFAKSKNLEVIQDSSYNVIIKKEASKGYENSPIVVIQGHMDMVCEKNNSKVHNFEVDPIELIVEGDFVKANGTTLGADNGIAVAYALALLDSEDIPHPPLEVLLTTDEETGMSGARNLDPKHIQGRILINIDNEEEGQLLVSCAGGLRTKVELKLEKEAVKQDEYKKYKLMVRGLKGGHSGMDIIKQRGNANKILGRVLVDLIYNVDYKLSEVNGGAKDNAIPREADAFILVKADEIEVLSKTISKWNSILKNEYRKADPGLVLQLEESEECVQEVLSRKCRDNAVKLLYMIPNGIQTMSMDIEGLVQSSSNLGIVRTNENSIIYESSVRSSIKSLKEDIVKQTAILAQALGAEITTHSEYPEWQYDSESKIREVFKKVYKEMYGKDAEIVAIHAGVECGLFKEKFPDIDMISFGPNLYDVHTPEERMSISSVKRMWEYLLNVLKILK